MAALVCYRPGSRSRLFYRVVVHRRRTGERRSFSEQAYAALIAPRTFSSPPRSS
jgi:hypothetical protein